VEDARSTAAERSWRATSRTSRGKHVGFVTRSDQHRERGRRRKGLEGAAATPARWAAGAVAIAIGTAHQWRPGSAERDESPKPWPAHRKSHRDSPCEDPRRGHPPGERRGRYVLGCRCRCPHAVRPAARPSSWDPGPVSTRLRSDQIRAPGHLGRHDRPRSSGRRVRRLAECWPAPPPRTAAARRAWTTLAIPHRQTMMATTRITPSVPTKSATGAHDDDGRKAGYRYQHVQHAEHPAPDVLRQLFLKLGLRKLSRTMANAKPTRKAMTTTRESTETTRLDSAI